MTYQQTSPLIIVFGLFNLEGLVEGVLLVVTTLISTIGRVGLRLLLRLVVVLRQRRRRGLLLLLIVATSPLLRLLLPLLLAAVRLLRVGLLLLAVLGLLLAVGLEGVILPLRLIAVIVGVAHHDRVNRRVCWPRLSRRV